MSSSTAHATRVRPLVELALKFAGGAGVFIWLAAIVPVEGTAKWLLLASGALAVVALVVAWVLGRGFVVGAWGQLRVGGANMDTLVSLGMLASMGVETTFFEPVTGKDIAALFRANTTLVFCESPGSLTFEIQDLPAIAAVAREKGARVAVDNTWATPLYHRSLDQGVDISIQAATKYLVGHSDAMMGTVTCNAATWEPFKHAYEEMGQFAGPDDMYLTLRGIQLRQQPVRRLARFFLGVAHHDMDAIAEAQRPAVAVGPCAQVRDRLAHLIHRVGPHEVDVAPLRRRLAPDPR